MSEAGVIWSLSRSNNRICVSKLGCVLLEVWTPVWTASSMGHWREMVKI